MIRKNRGILTVVSGFSGSGKGTIMKELMKKYADSYALSISATTRNPRPGETDGVEYFFRTKEQFEQMIKDDALIEYAQFVGNYYGTPKAYVEEQLEAGKDVILEIEIQGALKVKEKFPYPLPKPRGWRSAVAHHWTVHKHFCSSAVQDEISGMLRPLSAVFFLAANRGFQVQMPPRLNCSQ